MLLTKTTETACSFRKTKCMAKHANQKEKKANVPETSTWKFDLDKLTSSVPFISFTLYPRTIE